LIIFRSDAKTPQNQAFWVMEACAESDHPRE
jgi:hypothetical protein